MKISVIVPVYNTISFLEKCVSSILNQTYRDLELILIDDGSTDGSADICDSFAQKDNRVIVVHQKNSGVSAARNKGFDIASGEYITFVDSDDYLESSMYEVLVRLIIESKAEIVHCGYKRVNKVGEVLKEVHGTHEMLVQDNIEAINQFLGRGMFGSSLWNKIFNRKLLDNVRFEKNLIINEDVLVGFLAFQNATKIVFIDETFYCYTIHDKSACNSVNEKRKLLDSIKAAEIMIDNCRYPQLDNFLKIRLLDKQLRLYKWYIFNNKATIKNEKRLFKSQIKELYKSLESINNRLKLNYLLMMNCEWLYRFIYSIYDKLRVPNWDE